jgi:predicted dehydrogenase
MGAFTFGIMGAGKIAKKFCAAVELIENCQVVAISSKSMERAKEFAAEQGIPSAYDSYEQMLVREKPDCVYIAATTDAHYELCMLCLDHRVPVLCEKAMFVSSAQAETVFARAKELNVFVMEAMWSRFLPAVNQAKRWLEEGLIGKPQSLDMAIGFVAPNEKTNRYFNPELGGGVAYDITVYAYEIATYMVTGPIEDMQVAAVWADTGVDVTNHITLRYNDLLASLRTSIVSALDQGLVIYGDSGKIVVPRPHFAEEAILYTPQKEIHTHYKDEQTQNGFVYQIKEVMDCIGSGKIESPTVSHELTLQCARLFDRIGETRP